MSGKLELGMSEFALLKMEKMVGCTLCGMIIFLLHPAGVMVFRTSASEDRTLHGTHHRRTFFRVSAHVTVAQDFFTNACDVVSSS